LLLKELQVPVHRSHGQVRDFGFQIREDRLRGRVGCGMLQVMQDRIPLSEIF